MNYQPTFQEWSQDFEVFNRVIIDPGFEKLMMIQGLLFLCWLKTLQDPATQKNWANAYGKWAHVQLHDVELHFRESYAYELMKQWNQLKEQGVDTTLGFLADETDLLANPVLQAAFDSVLKTFLEKNNIDWLKISPLDLKDWDFRPGMILGWADGKKEEQGILLDLRVFDGMIFFLIQQGNQKEPVVRMAAVDGEFENGLIAPRQSWLDGFLNSIQAE